ncbi:hypothetical protein [Sicyoidochytrium minutum DNA virus]|nr:hypothetical protein [Sicyoidochytrium minutum DNA virus]
MVENKKALIFSTATNTA